MADDVILALDLGTTTGWVVGTKGSHVSGVWNLKGDRFSGGGMRFVNFKAKLNEMAEAYPKIDAVYYEEVRRHRGTDAAHVYGGLQAVLTAWCEENGLPYAGVPVGEIKKDFTGKGNADKDMMIAECVFRGYTPTTHDEADAIALFCLKAGIASEAAKHPYEEAA